MGKQCQTFLFFLGSKITADGDYSHEVKRRLLLGRKVMTNLDSIFKSRDITLRTKFRLVKAMVFPVVMTMIGPCKMSSRSLMFFGVHSKFLDVSFFRPILFIEDDLRAKRCHFAIKPAKESFSWKCFIELLVIFYAT